MLQLNGTARPSLALENLQEIESLKLSRSDYDEAEKVIAEALASLYAGQYPLRPTVLRSP
jgi:hypothetical protein